MAGKAIPGFRSDVPIEADAEVRLPPGTRWGFLASLPEKEAGRRPS
jgi:hypothetical protein